MRSKGEIEKAGISKKGSSCEGDKSREKTPEGKMRNRKDKGRRIPP